MEEEKTKRKNIVTIAIGVFVMLVLVVGSTYAFFQITGTTEDNTNTNFKGELENLTAYGTPHLSGTLSDLHITLNASDMAASKAPKTYWATNVKESNYEEERKDYTMSTASVSGGTVENGTLECTSDLTITATLVETEEGTEVLENPFVKEDGYVYLSATSETSGNKGKINPDTIDLKTIVDAKEYKTKISYTIVGNTSVDIKAAINIINRNANQNALAGKRLTFDIKNSNLQCEVSGKKAFMTTLVDYDKIESEEVFSAFKLGFDKQMAIEKIEFVKRLPSTGKIDRMISEGLAFDLTDTTMSPEKSVIGWLELSGNRGQVMDLSSGEPQIKEGDLYNLYIGSKETIYAKDLSYMSAFAMNLKDIKFENLNTSETTNMSHMFSEYKGTTLDLSNFDTSQVTNMTDMFGNCDNLEELKLGSWNLSSLGKNSLEFGDLSAKITFGKNFGVGATDMSYMFDGYQGTTLDLSNFDTSKVTNMSYMFGAKSGEGIEATIIFPQGFGSGATDMSDMFNSYKGTELDLSAFDTSKVTNMIGMFYNCGNLKELKLGSWNLSSLGKNSLEFGGLSAKITFGKNFGIGATDMSNMFAYYEGTTLDLSNFDTSKVTDMHGMFSSYTGTTLDLSTFDTTQVTDMSDMFGSCEKLTTLDLSSFTFDKVTTEGGINAGNYQTFYGVPSSCQVKIKSSQQQLFKKFTYDFEPIPVD